MESDMLWCVVDTLCSQSSTHTVNELGVGSQAHRFEAWRRMPKGDPPHFLGHYRTEGEALRACGIDRKTLGDHPRTFV